MLKMLVLSIRIAAIAKKQALSKRREKEEEEEETNFGY